MWVRKKVLGSLILGKNNTSDQAFFFNSAHQVATCSLREREGGGTTRTLPLLLFRWSQLSNGYVQPWPAWLAGFLDPIIRGVFCPPPPQKKKNLFLLPFRNTRTRDSFIAKKRGASEHQQHLFCLSLFLTTPSSCSFCKVHQAFISAFALPPPTSFSPNPINFW